MKQTIFILTTFLILNISSAQKMGSKVSMFDPESKYYTSIITAIQGEKYKVKYDGYEFEAWLTANQFNVSQSEPSVSNNKNNASSGTFNVDKAEHLYYTGVWYPVEILATDPVKGYKIHFTDWSSDWGKWVTKDKLRKPGGNNNNEARSQNNSKSKAPQMNGGVPQIFGTAWEVRSIFSKGTQPKSNFRLPDYVFFCSGGWEFRSGTLHSGGTCKVQGNKLITEDDGSNKNRAVYSIQWNAAENCVDLDDGKMITRAQYKGIAGDCR